jgi:hypothetical protein
MADDKTTTADLDVLALARAAGLERVIEQFPDDLLDAARAVLQDRADLPTVDGCAEPWPPMRTRSGR